MKTTKLILAGLALGAAITLMPQTGKATIVGSKHDFYANTNLWAGWGGYTPYKSNGTNNSVCRECHQIHHSQDPSKGPLWIHKSSANAGSYKLYDQAGSETYNAMGLPAPTLGSSSIACLSCHDGTVGINETTTIVLDGTGTSADGVTGTNGVLKLTSRVIAVNGNDLTHTHPIGIDYNNAVTTVNALYGSTELKAASAGSYPWTRLKGNSHSQLECATCHDIHATMSIPSGTARCLACHNK